MTPNQAYEIAQKNADEHGVVMVVGFQTNDTTGEKEIGYCPKAAVGPAFVHTVLHTIYPTNTE